MGESSLALHTAMNSVEALGRGFDVNFDNRLLYCKGIAGTRIVEINEDHRRELCVNDDLVVPDVSWDINSSQESIGYLSSGICSFQQMVDYFNKNANISGASPPGSFNSAFSFSGSKHIDALSTKILSMEGFCIPIAKFQLLKNPLVLKENVRKAVPACWDPPSLSSFIENFGTHVITSVTIGGKDMIYVKQNQTSPLSKAEIKNYVQDIAKQRFCEAQSQVLDLSLFNAEGIYPQPTCAPYQMGKEVREKDVTVVFRRRGGDDLEQNHVRWTKTVISSPDVIDMTFQPITSLLDGVNGKEHMVRAIDLYLESKPPIEEFRYFLEFQIPRIWAPIRENIPRHQRKEPVYPSLQFSIMGQKLYVSQEQISVGRKPVTGLRLCLEGTKQNRLSIRLQHLASLPKILQPYWDAHVPIGAPKWQGPEEQDSRWFEPVKWKNFSHVSTAPIENPESFIGDLCLVTGAQLGVWDFGSRNVLYMKLLYSRIPGCTLRRSFWDHVPNERSKNLSPSRSDAFDGYSSLTPGNASMNKLVKFVDTTEMCKRPEDIPGHWVVTGGKLGVEKGKIVLRVKYALLNY